MNRLNLDFSIESIEDRTKFIDTYLKNIKFTPTDTEKETIANYILWGKNSEGKNLKQLKEVQLKTKWDTDETESLDELKENPSFQETSIHPITETPLKYKTEKFSREEARKFASPDLLAQFEILWNEIDKLELTINYYDLKSGKRKNPPRQSLLEKFTPAQQSELETRAQSLSQYHYLKLRHLLKEKYSEQFHLKDFYTTKITPLPIQTLIEPNSPILDADIPVFPFGLITQTPLSQKIFNFERFPIPSDFSDSELEKISIKLWEDSSTKTFFDFRNIDHVYSFLQLFEEFSFELDNLPIDSTFAQLFHTFQFYKAHAHLTPLQEEILTQKIAHKKNQDIATYINEKYNKTYNANYISTIFKQKIITSINEVAIEHRETLENIFFPENFKTCKDCGLTLLLNSQNFVRKAKSKDGFSSRCKACEKNKRQGVK